MRLLLPTRPSCCPSICPACLQFPDTVEAALREADRDHDGVVSMQVRFW